MPRQVRKEFSYFGKDLEAMAFAANYHEWIMEEFKPYLGQSVAEVGAGTGDFSICILKHIRNLVAFEPSDNIFPLLKTRFENDTRVETIHGTFTDEHPAFQGYFDSIFYINVLEHIENDEAELSHVYRTLRHGGHALIFVPALSFLYGELDKKLGHYRRYHKKDLIRIATRTEFTIRKIKYFDIAGILPWLIFFVILRRSMNAGKMSLYDRWIVPLMKRIEQRITPPVGKNLLLVLQK